jgi:hypothetical protein
LRRGPTPAACQPSLSLGPLFSGDSPLSDHREAHRLPASPRSHSGRCFSGDSPLSDHREAHRLPPSPCSSSGRSHAAGLLAESVLAARPAEWRGRATVSVDPAGEDGSHQGKGAAGSSWDALVRGRFSVCRSCGGGRGQGARRRLAGACSTSTRGAVRELSHGNGTHPVDTTVRYQSTVRRRPSSNGTIGT